MDVEGTRVMIISMPFRDHNPRLAVLAGGLGLGLLILLGALFRVQVVQAKERYSNREDAQSLRRIRIPSARGEIVDRVGVVLADNRPSYDIAIYLNQLGRITKNQDVAKIATPRITAISQVLGLPVTVTSNDILRHYEVRRPLPLPLWRAVTKEQIAVFEERASNLPGANLIADARSSPIPARLPRRACAFRGSADGPRRPRMRIRKISITIRLTAPANKAWNILTTTTCAASAGGHTIQVNPGGSKVKDVSDEEAERGNRLVLTIDARIQRLVENALERTVLSAGKELRGAAVVIDPRSGEILAMASVPNFDPNIFTPGAPAGLVNSVLENPGKPLLNRATGARYAPGSTFKPITLLAGLESGAISPEDRVVCKGSLKIGNHTFGCWQRSGHGSLDSYMAVLESCDVWFYEEGMRTGVDAISRMAMEFGLGRPTGLDFGHEVAGLVPTPAWKRAAIRREMVGRRHGAVVNRAKLLAGHAAANGERRGDLRQRRHALEAVHRETH